MAHLFLVPPAHLHEANRFVEALKRRLAALADVETLAGDQLSHGIRDDSPPFASWQMRDAAL